MENILLNAKFYGLDLPDMDGIQTLPTEQDWKEVENNNEFQNEAHVAPNKDIQNHVFAIPKIYNCMYCDKRFYNRRAIRIHQMDHVKKLLRCIRCGKKSNNTQYIHRHFAYFHPGQTNDNAATTSKKK